VLTHDDVTALLSAQYQTLLVHRLKHVSITNGRFNDLDIRRLHGSPETQIRHHGSHNSVRCEFTGITKCESKHGKNLVAIDNFTGAVDSKAPVGVAIVGDSGMGTIGNHRRLKITKVGRSTVFVDIESIGRCVNFNNVSASCPVGGGPNNARGTVGTVDYYPHAIKSA
jgi:hypothetical protein